MPVGWPRKPDCWPGNPVICDWRSCELDGWGCGCCIVGGAEAFCRPLKSGALLAAVGSALAPPSSTTLKLMMSTMLETSFLMLLGSADGSDFPVSLRLQRYIARANSGKCSWPDRVVSARVLRGTIC